jgi:hypothetical protein
MPNLPPGGGVESKISRAGQGEAMAKRIVVRVPRLPEATQLGVGVGCGGMELEVEPVEVTLELGVPPMVAVRCRVVGNGRAGDGSGVLHGDRELP